eukprot:g5871.t1
MVVFEKTREAPPKGKMNFAKALAGTCKKTRDKAVINLRKWLSQQDSTSVSDMDFLKIWKALYYCFWMSDKTPIQQELAKTLVGLIGCFKEKEMSVRFVRAFYATMVREWGGIDRLRLDKFLSLVRHMTKGLMVFTARQGFDEEAIEEMSSVFMEDVITKSEAHGLRVFVTEIFLDELFKVTQGKVSNEVLQSLLQPFYFAVACCSDKRLTSRVISGVFDVLVERAEVDWPNLSLMEASVDIFELASNSETVEHNRSSLYKLSKKLKRAAKQNGESEIEYVEDTKDVGETEDVDGEADTKSIETEDEEKKNTNSMKEAKEEEEEDTTNESGMHTDKQEKKQTELDGNENEKLIKMGKRKRQDEEDTNEERVTPKKKVKSENGHEKGITFNLNENKSQSVREARRALKKPRIPASKVPSPSHGILKLSPDGKAFQEKARAEAMKKKKKLSKKKQRKRGKKGKGGGQKL